MGSSGVWRGLVPSVTLPAQPGRMLRPRVSPVGGALLQNGQTTAEIQEEVALTNLGSSSGASKRHSAADKMHFPRANLQTITTLGTPGHPIPILSGKLGAETSQPENSTGWGSEGPAAPGLPKFAVLTRAVFPCAALHFQARGSLVKSSWPRRKEQRTARAKRWSW